MVERADEQNGHYIFDRKARPRGDHRRYATLASERDGGRLGIDGLYDVAVRHQLRGNSPGSASDIQHAAREETEGTAEEK